ncbi:DeoR family transcriptional regulator [Sinorhizobium meliloti]|uniref:DeoR family transcriptional regulator n=1 Tax=Rhizobium meliloti TaxID=382 RepID=UPI000FD6FE74|nr:DeoR family transcriptional regulator [Sinorhizobium meliloti]MDW9376300.1 DeoR family transcriptional regulator [Sinorhizobium meliloti]MDW9495068.1 DeoR family transcriptional regulator [Sinorhizobium meliloti]MDW9563159.1 DeoR family transcriptional regulator [Sinorhizobium meliloti]MDW9650499.1 DeoR family transcriptional regulator [Sinorhizobium meliloti]MDW9862705.1 DeoR family transcriptional regulator [Sinorhizobium meliloti]
MASRRETRIATLSDALSARRVVHLKEAAALLGVSEMTVRRDVADNPGLFGYLGGHIVPAAEIEGDAPYELARAADSHAGAKRQACIHAARHIRPDETIFIDCGTTLEYLVELIPDDYAITAICYSLNTAERLTRKTNLRMVMLGGVYHPSSASFSGAPGIETLDQLGINVAFLSAAGIDPARGATCVHFHEVPVKQKVISLARENYLVADSSKLGKLKAAFFAPPSAFRSLITEDGETALAADLMPAPGMYESGQPRLDRRRK